MIKGSERDRLKLADPIRSVPGATLTILKQGPDKRHRQSRTWQSRQAHSKSAPMVPQACKGLSTRIFRIKALFDQNGKRTKVPAEPSQARPSRTAFPAAPE